MLKHLTTDQIAALIVLAEAHEAALVPIWKEIAGTTVVIGSEEWKRQQELSDNETWRAKVAYIGSLSEGAQTELKALLWTTMGKGDWPRALERAQKDTRLGIEHLAGFGTAHGETALSNLLKKGLELAAA